MNITYSKERTKQFLCGKLQHNGVSKLFEFVKKEGYVYETDKNRGFGRADFVS